jgi:HK97 gp10 family phage protein
MVKFSPEWRRYVTKLRELRTSVAPALQPAMRQAADLVVETQRHLVPVEHGDLRDSIQYTLAETKVTVTAGGKQAPYAVFVEFGTSSMHPQPYFFAGWRAAKKPVRRLINKAIKVAVAKAMT